MRSRHKWGALPLGELHSPAVCALCGSRKDLKLTILLSTHSRGMICRDSVLCVRRQRQGRLG